MEESMSKSIRPLTAAHRIVPVSIAAALFLSGTVSAGDGQYAEECLGFEWRQEALVVGLVGALCPGDKLEGVELSARVRSANELLLAEIQRVRDCRFEFIDEMNRSTDLGRSYGQYHGGLLALNGYVEAVLIDEDNIDRRLSADDLVFFLQDVAPEETAKSDFSCLPTR